MNIFNGPITIVLEAAAPKYSPISMSNTEFIRGYQNGLVAHLASDAPDTFSDYDVLEMLKARIEEDSDDNDLYYFLGNIIGLAQAQAQR